MYSIDPPSGVLDDKMPWYTAKVGESLWNIVKAKLTGKTQPDGSSYSSTVNLSDADADRLIENMKKDPRGYPQFNDGGGGMSFYDNYEKYQAWLVETYLDKEPEEEEEEIPEGLDDLLGSIQNEPVEPKVTVIQSSAIVPSKFFGEDRYDKYRDELTATGTIEGEYLTPEERREAFKKRNDKIGFQEFVKNILDRKKSADKFTSDKTEVKGGAIVKAPKINPGKLVPTEAGEETEENLEDILKGIDAILNSLKEQEKTKKKAAEKERKSSEKKKRKKSEDKLEGGIFKGLAKATNKVLAPVKGLFERVFDFIKTVLLGRVLFKLLEWIGDEGNREKLDAIGKFLNKTWPALLAAYLLFGNGLGRFIARMSAMALRFVPVIAKTIFALAKAHPLAAAAIGGAGLFVAGYAIPKLMPGTVGEQERKTAAAPGTVEEKIKALEERKKNLSITDRLFTVEGEINDQIEFLKSGRAAKYGAAPGQGFAGGGLVQGFSGGGHAMASGTDTIPAMLTPGEFVMSKGAVQKYGSSTLASMNAAGGGTNRPKMLGGTVYASEGGQMPEVPVSDERSTTRTGDDFDAESMSAALERMTGVTAPTTVPTATVTPTEPIIPSASKDKDKEKESSKAKGGGGTLKLKAQDFRDLAFIVSGEAQPNTDDEYGVAAAVLNRLADPSWPDTIMKIAHQKGQFAAVEDGHARDDKELAAKLASPEGQAKIVKALKKLQGRTDFKGTTMYKFMGGSDVKFSNRGNFYHYKEQKGKNDPPPSNPQQYWKKLLGPATGPAVDLSTTTGSGGNGGSGDSSSGDGGGSTKMSKAELREALKVGEGAAFNYNTLRESLGVKTSSISRSSRPTSTAAYEQVQSQQMQQQDGLSTPTMYDPSETAGKDVPTINANEMVSSRKIQVLGITI